MDESPARLLLLPTIVTSISVTLVGVFFKITLVDSLGKNLVRSCGTCGVHVLGWTDDVGRPLHEAVIMQNPSMPYLRWPIVKVLVSTAIRVLLS